ncbi:HNH endonuclease signature motif containing protein [soil metagenome]
MKTTTSQTTSEAPSPELFEEELATLTAHLNAATARWVELAGIFAHDGAAVDGDVARWLAFRFGLTTREAREYLRVAEALHELPSIRDVFARGELSFTKVRVLTTVATRDSEESLLELAIALTASQLERALRAFRRLRSEEARESHELEYVDYYWAEDGSLFLRARLPAEEGTLLVRALDAARERVRERREERSKEEAGPSFEPARSPQVEALVELAQTALAAEHAGDAERARVVVHVDAAALTGDDAGRSDLEHGPVIAPETARRLGCDATTVTFVERDGLPLSVGRRRRSVPPSLRRVLEARDDGCCRWPGCERRRHLAAHHRTHWASGGETSLDNLVLLCWQHHRLVHEGGYTIEDARCGELRFRNRHGVLCPSVPRSPPRGSPDALAARSRRAGLTIGPRTNQNELGDRIDLSLTVAAIDRGFG